MELSIPSLSATFVPQDGQPGFKLEFPGLSISTGTVIFVVGPNGSGKSVFLSLLSGVLPGDGRASGVPWREAAQHVDWVSTVRQNAEQSLALELTVGENLLLRFPSNAVLDWLRPSRFRRRIEASLGIHGELLAKYGQRAASLSAGQKQVLAFVAVTLQRRRLLLLDEFLSAADQHASRRLREMVRVYAQTTPACVLVVSHDIRMTLEDADRVLVWRSGRMVEVLERGGSDWNEEALNRLVTPDVIAT